jgi:hypothetical protein
MSDIHQILEKCIGKGRYEAVLEALIFSFDQSGEKDYKNEAVNLLGRLNQLHTDERRGVISAEDIKLERNRIASATTELLVFLPLDVRLPQAMLNTLSSAGNPVPADQIQATAQANDKIPLLIGLFLTLLSAFFVFAFPCPSNAIAWWVRVLTAVGLSALAFYLGGSLTIFGAKEDIKTTGILAVFLCLLYFNPAANLSEMDCTTEVPVTIFVHGNGGRQDLVLRQQGHVLMDYRGERKRMAINENGEAFFSNLKTSEKIRLGVDFSEPYQPVRPDSVYTIDKSGQIYLQVALLHLEKVYGRTIWQDNPLSGVVVSIGPTLSDTTDALGYYDIYIPPALQRKEQEVIFFKPGFRLLTKKSFPQTNDPLNVVMEADTNKKTTK